ncbi:Calcium-binding EF-hand family protein isoform 1 [Hibiscus syriacus]|uniref:Calcium-binding EF-hand family protein isoform 1 n=1 Tax=Hibiscus syriacus TaxID=106335 RepID=A0A6A3D1P7_HIBSY|nr:Calcium-binding EF-hand family protein isoform 1 [Hibiscus syriacus]
MASLANVLLSRRVQEMVINGEEPESLYICRDEKEAQTVPSPLTPIPIIDLNLLSSSPLSTKEEKEEEEEDLQKLKSALCSWGCFQAINHGIPSCFFDEFRQVTREFFQLSMEEKNKYSKGVEEIEGYGGDPSPEEGQFLDWQDRLFLTVYPQELRDTKFWPQNPKSFRFRKVHLQDEDGDRDCFEIHGQVARMRMKAFKFSKISKWFTVPTLPDALLILIGDQMEIMTNGIWKSPVHRVVNNKEKERTSIAVFYTPEKHKEIGPVDGVVNVETPPLFNKVRDYEITFWKYYQRGIRVLHTTRMKING